MLARSLIVLFVLLSSCSKQSQSELAVEVIKNGDIELKITPSAKSIRTCDLLELSIDLTYPQTYKVKLPDSKDNFGDFSIYQINQNSAVAINEKLNRLSQIIILEPGLPASHKIPELSFQFWNEENIQSTLKSQPISLEVTSILNLEENTDIEDIITETKKPKHLVTIIGSTALFVTIIYLLFFCKAEEDPKENALREALFQFQELSKLDETELLKQLPRSCCIFLKETYGLQKLPNNLDVIISELAVKQELKPVTEKLKSLNSTYNKLRYSSDSVEKKSSRDLFTSFDSFFKEIQT